MGISQKLIAIIDCGSSYIANIQQILREFGHASKVIPLAGISEMDFSEFSGIIISGSPAFITKMDTQSYVNKFAFIKDIDTPVLGICNGHQVLGLLYGAEISLGKKVEKKEKISIVKSDALFQGIADGTEFQEEHCESITLPKDFTLLATSKSCENEAMRHATKPFFGVQFHPEVSGGEGKRLIGNFLGQLK